MVTITTIQHQTPAEAPSKGVGSSDLLGASKTPRTDAEEWTAGQGDDDRTVVWSDFARKLELEIFNLKRKCAHADEALRTSIPSDVAFARYRDYEEMKACAERAAACLNEIYHSTSCTEGQLMLIHEWRTGNTAKPLHYSEEPERDSNDDPRDPQDRNA